MDIRHIKITSTEGLYRINEKKAFKGLIVSFTNSSSQVWLHCPEEIHLIYSSQATILTFF